MKYNRNIKILKTTVYVSVVVSFSKHYKGAFKYQ